MSQVQAGGQLWQFGDIVVTGPQRGAAQPARPAQFVTWRYWYYIHTPINHLNFPLHQERCQQNFAVSLGTSISISMFRWRWRPFKQHSMILQCESTSMAFLQGLGPSWCLLRISIMKITTKHCWHLYPPAFNLTVTWSGGSSQGRGTMLKLQKCLQNLCKTPDYIKCYLCLEKVKEKHWNSGNHRLEML